MRFVGARRILRIFAIALATTVAVTGCAQLPISGTAQVGPSIEGGLSTDYLYYSPSGPIAGQTQADIVDGFITAGTAPQNDYATAREFLTQDFKAKWNPNGEVLIQTGKGQLTFLPDGTARYSVWVQARVSAEGTYSTVNPPANQELGFTLTRQNGQWRISSAPNVTIVNRPVFDVIFRSYSVYFFDRQLKYLVPDLRWFPSRASTGTRLVNALLDGPSRWLAPAVQSAIPAGTKLAIDSVTTDGSVAIVDLSSKALTANLLHRQYMKEQLRATLSQLTTVGSVSLYIDHSLQDIPSLAVSQPPAASYTPVALTDSDLVHVTSAGATSISGAKQVIQQLRPTDFAIASDDQKLALLTAGGLYSADLDQVSTNPRLIDVRPGLLAPVIDPQGYIWSVSAESGSQIYAIDANGIRNWVLPSTFGSHRRIAFAISPEGSRLAMVTTHKGVRSISVASIIRDRNGKPVSLGPSIQVAQEVKQPTTIGWAYENTIVGLAEPTAGSVTAFTTVVGGQSSTLAAAMQATHITGSNSNSSIHVVDSTGSLYQFQVYDWKLIATGVRAVHFSN